MPATYYVDDGGSAPAPYDTWAKAATSLSALDDAVTFADGDIIYIGHDHDTAAMRTMSVTNSDCCGVRIAPDSPTARL